MKLVVCFLRGFGSGSISTFFYKLFSTGDAGGKNKIKLISSHFYMGRLQKEWNVLLSRFNFLVTLAWTSDRTGSRSTCCGILEGRLGRLTLTEMRMVVSRLRC